MMKISAACLALLLAASGASAVSRNDIVEGNLASPVRVLIYEDMQSGRGGQFQQMLEEKLLPKYRDKVLFVHRDFPVGRHDWALQAALAARWVFTQSNQLGVFVRREIIAQHDSINARNVKQWFIDYAYRNHLDPKAIVDAMSDKSILAMVDQDIQGATARGVTTAPTVYVGGQAFVENIIYDDLARAIDEALAK
jgi:protein-disulfide isomerase